jgi:hypothetical protein
MKTLAVCALPLLLAACADDHHHAAAIRPASETLRARPANVQVASVERTKHLNYPRPGEFRNYGQVEIASNAYMQGNELPAPIAELDPNADSMPTYIERTQVYTPEARIAPVRTVIRTDGSVATASYHVTPLGPNGTNRAVINQITGLPVDQ